MAADGVERAASGADPSLRSDCARCTGLCCVALGFQRSASFAFAKAEGERCRHLGDDHRCGVHDQLNDIGMRGCTIFECFGAGQQVTQVTYAGEGLGADPERDRQRFAVFAVLRAVHEMRWLLAEAPRLPPAGAEESRAWQRRLAELAQAAPETVLSTDLAAIRSAVGELLRTASRGARSRRGADLAGADLLGADLRARDLRDADLRGALLVAADLRGSDLTNADLLGADLRDADLRAADASRALFLTQPQVNATRGDGATRLPSALDRPVGWT